MTAPPGDDRRLFVSELAGRVRIVRDGAIAPAPFLDVSERVATGGTGGERGFFSVAFAPDYTASGRFYVFYTARAGGARGLGDLIVEEYRRGDDDPDRADPASARQVLQIPHRDFGNHNGGQLAFGPDGLLYAGTGDGGGFGDPARNGQNTSTLLGKLLRIDPVAAEGAPYRVPPDNPFVGRPGADEVYAYGLRNPWRFSFDRDTGDLALADVGQDAVEEVDLLRRGEGAGANFGWPVCEGDQGYPLPLRPCSLAGHVPPVLERLHTTGACSITGGFVIRDRALGALAGRYVYSDLCDGELRTAALDMPRARDDRGLGLRVRSPVSFGEDAAGCVYVVSVTEGVLRLAPPAGPAKAPCRLAVPALGLTVRAARSQRLARRAVRVALRCSAECAYTVGARVAGVRLGTRRGRAPAGRFVTVSLALPRRVLARRSAIARVSVRVRSADGSASRSLRVRLRR